MVWTPRLQGIFEQYMTEQPLLLPDLILAAEDLFNVKPSIGKLEALFKLSIVVTDEQFNLQNAVEAGAGFVSNPELAADDMRQLQECGYDLAELARRRQREGKGIGLSPSGARLVMDSVWDDSNPDLARLYSIADVGVRIPSPANLVYTSILPPIRNKYSTARNVIDRKIENRHAKGKVLILPAEAIALIGNIVVSPIDWVPKPAVEEGRTIVDPSNNPEGTNLNTPDALEASRAIYGPSTQPGLSDLALMVRDFTEEQRIILGPEFDIEDILGMTTDLSDAYGLMIVDPTDVHKMCSEMADGRLVVNLNATFGTAAAAIAMGPLSRAYEAAANAVIYPRPSKVYTDDLATVTTRQLAASDKQQLTGMVITMYGSGAVAPNKEYVGNRPTWIGYTFDIPSQTVSLSEKNFLKLVFLLFSTDISKPVSLRKVRRAQALLVRASNMYRPMRAVTAAVFATTKGRTNNDATFMLSIQAQRAFVWWRAQVVAAKMDPRHGARPFSSFDALIGAQFALYVDACLYGLGFFIHKISDTGVTDPDIWKCGQVRTDPTFDCLGFSKFQNAMEFMSTTVAFIVMAQLGVRGANVLMFADSTTSLKWGSTERFRGCLNQNCAIVHLTVAAEFDFAISEVRHVRGDENSQCDALSRYTHSPRDFCEREDQILDLDHDDVIQTFLALCDPTWDILDAPVRDGEDIWTPLKELLKDTHRAIARIRA